MSSLKNLFLLNQDVVYLNHGSFGACPLPVFETYQQWQRDLEQQPVQFLGAELPEHFQRAREALGKHLGTSADNLVFIPNVTFGVNVIARSLELSPGDEILASNHEYGACDNTWEFICKKMGCTYTHQEIPLPVKTSDEILDQFWQGVTPKTRVIFVSHITSPTALRLPVEAICQRAREAGIITLIDGAHAPGQIPLDMEAIGADFYTGNCHKWMMAPKGSAFLYARTEVQGSIDPLVVSWGWGEQKSFSYGSNFLDYLQWWGTKDPAAYLSVPAAIQFQLDHNWSEVCEVCHELARQAVERICQLTEISSPYSNFSDLFYQMAIAPLPSVTDLKGLKHRLYNEYRVEIPCIEWHRRHFIRVSVQGYNCQTDIDALVDALEDLLPQFVDPQTRSSIEPL